MTIRGEREPQESSGNTCHKQESHHDSFSRPFTLPDSANLEGIKADYRNGILTVLVPQRPDAKSRIIKANAQRGPTESWNA